MKFKAEKAKQNDWNKDRWVQHSGVKSLEFLFFKQQQKLHQPVNKSWIKFRYCCKKIMWLVNMKLNTLWMTRFGQLVSESNFKLRQKKILLFQFSRAFSEIGKYQAMLIFFTGFAIMGVSLENVSISYVLSYVQCDLNFSTHQKGVLTAISFLGIVSTSYFW